MPTSRRARSSHRRPRALLLGPLLLGPLLLAGCGDDSADDDATTTTADVDTQAVIDRVNGICGRFDEEFENLASEATELAELAEQAVDLYGAAIDDLEAVEASGEQAETLDKMVASLEQARDDMAEALETGDDDEITAAGQAIDERNEELDEEVRDAGFTACGDESDETADEPTETTVSSDAALTHVDLAGVLTAPTGFGLQSVDDETVATLNRSYSSEPELVAMAEQFGTAYVFEGDVQQGLLIFVGLKETPDDATQQALLEGMAASGVDATPTTIGSEEGVTYTDQSSGAITFASVHGDTIVVAVAQDQAALEAIVSGLFEQNPDL